MQRSELGSQFNEPYVSIEFDREGARRFERITAENVGQRLAIVLDNTVYSAPVIRERIAGGRRRLPEALPLRKHGIWPSSSRAGALPAPVRIDMKRIVGPSLGQDSIRQGLRLA